MTAAATTPEVVCPFCASTDVFHERADYSSSYVICNDCSARGPTSCDDTAAEALASESGDADPGELAARRLWSRRPADTASAERIKALEAGLAKAAGQFEFYVENHAAKASAEGDAKAKVNANFARMCRALLTPKDASPVAGDGGTPA